MTLGMILFVQCTFFTILLVVVCEKRKYRKLIDDVCEVESRLSKHIDCTDTNINKLMNDVTNANNVIDRTSFSLNEKINKLRDESHGGR